MKLTVDGKSYTQPLILNMDPRIKSLTADVGRQFAIAGAAGEGMTQSFDALSELQSTRAQVKTALEKISSADIKQKLIDFDKKAATLQGAAVPGFAGIPATGKQPENLSTLNQRFGRVLAIADAADVAPTTQTEAVAKELETALRDAITRWQEMKRIDVTALNERLEQEKVGTIDPERHVGDGPASDVDGDDEP